MLSMCSQADKQSVVNHLPSIQKKHFLIRVKLNKVPDKGSKYSRYFISSSLSFPPLGILHQSGYLHFLPLFIATFHCYWWLEINSFSLPSVFNFFICRSIILKLRLCKQGDLGNFRNRKIVHPHGRYRRSNDSNAGFMALLCFAFLFPPTLFLHVSHVLGHNS